MLLLLFTACMLMVLGAGTAAWWLAGRLGLVHGPVTAALGFGENWSDRAVAGAKAQGEVIVAAIEQYRSAHGEPPNSLDTLVPGYIASIPDAPVGSGRWKLGTLTNHPSEYALSVRSRWMNQSGYHGIEWLQYNSLDRRWATFRDESLLFD